MVFLKRSDREPPRPVIAITTGDPAGIGPEVVMKALRARNMTRTCRPVVVGRPSVMLTHATILNLRARFLPIEAIEDLNDITSDDGIPLLSTSSSEETDQTRLGEPNAQGGLVAYESIRAAVELCKAGKAAAIVTAPINKAALRLAGINYPGHTEMIADLAGAEEVAMMLVGGGMKVVIATIHIPLRDVPSQLDSQRLGRLFSLIGTTFERLGVSPCRIGVCGLNPHAGEGGIFGDEEKRVITPAIEAGRRAGLTITGPYPADTIFHRQIRGDFDVVVAMYHDQGLIPVKTIDFGGCVNVTIGLPFPRTSVDHGTAYDIAGKGVASERSMTNAIMAAVELARGRLGF